jgi:hypothetical protein
MAAAAIMSVKHANCTHRNRTAAAAAVTAIAAAIADAGVAAAVAAFVIVSDFISDTCSRVVTPMKQKTVLSAMMMMLHI